jgi:3'-5' exoribonuclease
MGPCKHILKRGYALMRIKDLVVGDEATIDLLVLSSSIRLTTNKKPYLDLTLSDGIDKISAKKWDWNISGKPEVGTVVTINADVTEWAGNKQLIASSVSHSTKGPEEFAPKGDFDIDDYKARLNMLLLNIENAPLNNLVAKIFDDYLEQWETVPGATSVHHAYLAGAFQHSIDTAIIAKAIATNIDGCNVDLCVAGALLHDVGKLFVYELNGSVINYTEYGHLLEHIIGGVVILDRYRTEENSEIITLLQHIIAAHHGKLEFGSPVAPKFLEAWIVSYADDIDAKANIIQRINRGCAGKFTEKEWTLNNSAMLSQRYIEEVMNR